MPTYEYVCRSCGHLFEIVQSMKDESLTECPVCGGELRKVFAAPAISFKGSGFYATDHRVKTETSERSSDKPDRPEKTDKGDSKDGKRDAATTKPAEKKSSPDSGSDSGPGSGPGSGPNSKASKGTSGGSSPKEGASS